MTYVIHGATGAQGGPVVAALVAAGESVGALTRSADAVVDGARVLPVDLSSVAELTEAYRGADGVFVHLPVVAPEEQLAYARNIVAAVSAARPARVVFSTSGEPGDAAAVVMKGLADSAVPTAVIQPMYYLENLLLPFVADGIRERGVLPYPLRDGMRVSWVSHLDIADAAVSLFGRPDICGTVTIGQYPGVTGSDLAAAFGDRVGRPVVYEQITPDSFRESVAPLIGEGPAAGVAATYAAVLTAPAREIAPHHSVQSTLGITPRTTREWLDTIAF